MDADERICENCSHCQRIIDNEVYCDYFASFFEYENNNVKFGCARLIQREYYEKTIQKI